MQAQLQGEAVADADGRGTSDRLARCRVLPDQPDSAGPGSRASTDFTRLAPTIVAAMERAYLICARLHRSTREFSQFRIDGKSKVDVDISPQGEQPRSGGFCEQAGRRHNRLELPGSVRGATGPIRHRVVQSHRVGGLNVA